MEKTLLWIACLCLIGTLDANARSIVINNVPKPKPKHGACLAVAIACENAGYRLANIPGKNIMKDCLHPIINGKTIANVSPNSSDIQNCKERLEQTHYYQRRFYHRK